MNKGQALRRWTGNAIDKACSWYRETHTSEHTGLLSNRSQAFSLVIVMGVTVLVYDGIKNKIRREWNEALGILMTGVTAAKVWTRSPIKNKEKKDVEPKESSG